MFFDSDTIVSVFYTLVLCHSDGKNVNKELIEQALGEKRIFFPENIENR